MPSPCRCRVCNAHTNFRLIEEVPVSWPGETIVYQMMECAACRSVLAEPSIPAPPDYYSYPVPAWRWEFGELARDLQNVAIAGSNVLEIGCNDGNCLKHLDGQRYHLQGIDFNLAAIERARVNGLDCSAKTIQDLLAEGRRASFDLVYFFHVLEHVADPLQFLAQASELLKPGGYIALSVPNAERLIVLAARERDDYPPNHLYRFSDAGITTLLAQAQLEVIRAATQGRDVTLLEFISWTVHGWLRNSLFSALYSERLPRWVRIFGKLPFFIAAFPFGTIRFLLNIQKPGLARYVLARAPHSAT